jgi:two-component system chemotaxis response regulator CheV
MIRRMTSEQLRTAGFTNLLLFENGLRAHQKLLEFHQEMQTTGNPITHYVNLVLTDIEMPQMDGLTLCKAIKKEMGHTNLPVIIYSSLINQQMAEKCRSVGSNAHISKPQIEQIVSIIDRECGIA